MRLHHLTVTAFGPFAGSVEVDLDEVAAGGLFLIRGATGAGKTSLLDAIAFALYADVPGSRSKKGLHSDHADRGSVPTVTLEFTAVGRRFRIERSPEFFRPKSRGTGETKVQAKAVLWEQRASGWEALSTRHDEIADVVKDVLGMGLEQFNKVVLLPQGDFAAFLRATPEERRGLLEKLFDVSTYAGVEEWFATQRKESAARVEAHHAALRSDLAVLADVLADAPAGLVAAALGTTETPETLEDLAAHDWSALPLDQLPAALDAIVAGLEAASVQALAAVDAARSADSIAATALHGAREVSARRERGTRATESLARLTAEQQAVDDAAARLDAAVRARSVSGDLSALSRADDAVARAQERLAVTSSRVDWLGVGREDSSQDDTGHDTGDGARAHLHELVDRMSEATAVLDDAERHRRAWHERTREHAVLAEQSRQVQVARAQVEARMAARRDAAVAAQRELAETTQAAGAVDVAAARVKELVSLHRTRVAVETGDLELAAADVAVAQCRTAAQDLRDAYQDLRQSRLDGMAAELAAQLDDDHPCPVCGSPDHPVPATGGGAATPEAVEAAERRWQAASARLSAAEARHASLKSARAERLAQLGEEQRDADALAEAVSEARSAHADLVQRAASLERARTLVETAEAEIASLAEQAADLRDGLTAARTTLGALESDLAGDAATVREDLDRHARACPCAPGVPLAASSPDDTAGQLDSLAAVRRHHDAAAQSLEQHHAAMLDLEAARTTRVEVLTLTQAALAEAGFGDAHTARTAVLAPAQVAALQATVSTHETALVQATTVLEDPEVVAALEGVAPDLETLTTASDAARQAYTAALATDTLVRRTHAGVERVRASVADRGHALTTAAAHHEVLRELADAVAGTSASNTLRMRLSAFVLAARLEKVATLANERLATMGEGRYQLRHTDGLAARGARSGLGLEVLDLWTGQARDTSSLSGGESFMASLALALGLADAVREESGGFDLQTLFVDEGFGTLDDESLEQVMAVLDDLREGGRAVGVVSHVAELRTRIASQVVVIKTERGSTVRTGIATDAAPAA